VLDHLPWRRWRALPPQLAPHPETKNVVREHGCAELMSPLWTSKAAASRYSTSSPEGLKNGREAMLPDAAPAAAAPASHDPIRCRGQGLVAAHGVCRHHAPHTEEKPPTA
jgi:hypothetical protein